MNHAEALKTHTVERYLLGELTDSETEEFERHYFACAECTGEVAAAAILKANARAVFEDEAEPVIPRAADTPGFWKRLLASFQAPPALAAGLASLALGVVCSYQIFVVTPQLKRQVQQAYVAAPLPSFALTGRTRGDSPTLRVPGDARFFSVSFDVDPGLPYRQYRCDLKDAGGAIRFTLPVPLPALGQPITILLPARDLDAGSYELILSGLRAGGAGEVQVGTYRFNLQRGSSH